MKQLYMLRAFLIVCMSVLFGGGNFALAQDQVIETLDFTTKNVKYSDYNKSWVWGNWNLTGGANNSGNWAYVRFGGKSTSSTTTVSKTSTIVGTSSISSSVDYVQIEHLGINGNGASSFKVSSIVLETSNDKDFTDITTTTTVTDADLTSSETTKSFKITPTTSIPANNYYRISINWSITNKNNTGLDIQKVILKKASSIEPAINVANNVVEYAADITSGEIPYTISNPVDGKALTATSNADWITDVTVGESAVTFTMTENTETDAREGKITLSYDGAETKVITVKQLAAVAKRTVTIVEPENGTLKVFRGEEEIVSGAQIPEGTELTIEATPAEGYKFRNWQAVDGSMHTYTTKFTFTIGESDVTFKANFDEIIYNTITWSVNGVESTTTVEQGSDITFTAPETVPDGYTFMGWLGETYGPSNEAPTFVTSATAKADVTYYAVFAKGSGTEETATLTASWEKESSTYTDRTYTDDKGNTWTTYSNELGNNGNNENKDARFGLNNNKYANCYFGSPSFSGNVTKIVMNVYNGSSSNDRSFYIDSEQTNKNGDLGTIGVNRSEQKVDKEITFDGTFNQFYIHSSDALGFLYIKVTYGSKTYTDYTTSVPATGTLTLVAHDTEGNYYATFSSDQRLVFPEDVEVSAVTRINENGTLNIFTKTPTQWEVTDGVTDKAVCNVKGTFVEKNQGVLLKSKNATVTYYFATSIPSGSVATPNLLKPVLKEDGTFEGKAGCKYYKLAYNDYNQQTGLGFYWGADDGAPFKSKKGLAYLEVEESTTSGAAPTYFLLGGDTDGISSVKNAAETKEAIIYNIAGQRVNAATKPGLYIIGGKKVVVK